MPIKMKKIDFKKELPAYKPKVAKPQIIAVPPANFLMIDGKGDPNTSLEFKNAIETLYSVAYTLKFMIKKGSMGIDYGVAPLEALWWAEDMNDFLYAKKDKWQWTAMILQPDFITTSLYNEAVTNAGQKKDLPALSKLRLEQFNEGTCAQVLYIGPYADEGPTIQNLHQFAKTNGYNLCDKHHEIYLSDQRKTAPEKLKTIIRQPVSKV
jgi:hypothetical protein